MMIGGLILCLAAALATVVPAVAADGTDWEEKAAFLAGAATVEELSEEVMEKFSSLRDRPLDLNAAPRGKLLSSGLLTAFQVDAIIGYRGKTGDILSFSELALVPGFSKEYAEALKPFTVLLTRDAPGHTEKKSLDQTLTLRSSARRDFQEVPEGPDVSFGIKYAAEWGEKAELRWSTRTAYGNGKVGLGTMSAALYGKRALGKLVLGNFNARFGQGLAQWNGFVLSGYPTVASFRKNGTGISPTGSFSPDLKGIASDWTWGHFTLTAAASLGKDNIATISNLTWTGRKATLGTTCVWSPVKKTATVSTDWRVGFPKLSLFGEIAVRKPQQQSSPIPFAALAGAVWTPKYGTKAALQGRFFSPDYKNDWSGVAAGFENAWISVTADAASNFPKGTSQYKTVIQLKRELAKDSLSVIPSIRLNARYRPEDPVPKRIDLRGDIAMSYGPWRLNGRYDALWSRDFAWLWYAEAGMARETGSLYARFSLFCIDNWDDRIYVYERDAPGSFNVPAYYGRGYALSLAGSAKRRRHAWHLRASWTSYPWNLSPKPSRLEFKVQYTLRLHRKKHLDI